jgi:phenylphosphate carboxylase gamma subunit
LRRKKMARKEYDTFLLIDPSTVPDEQETELIVRELTPKDRRYKYRGFYAKALVSKAESKYPDLLWIRLGRGQLQEKPWSIKILKEVKEFPKRVG